MAPKKINPEPDEDWQATSLRIRRAVYMRAWYYKLEKKKDLGEIMTEALDEYLKKRGA
jgi:hypothetical protein